MESQQYLSTIYFLGFLVALILFIKHIITKRSLHFRLLKILYADEFSNINSYYNPLLYFSILGLDGSVYLWYSFPFYYRKSDEPIKGDACAIETALLKNNKNILCYLIVSLVWLFGIGSILGF